MAAPVSKISLADLNAAGASTFIAVCGALFEHSPWIAAETFQRSPFSSIDALHASLIETMNRAPIDRQLALIAAHPDLVGRLARDGRLTRESTDEQAAAGLSNLTDDEITAFERFNAAYRERFGFPFVICARENKKAAILAAFPIRLANTREREMQTALREIAKIAYLRLADRLTDQPQDFSPMPASSKPLARLVDHSYGKSRVRLTKVTRDGDVHDLKELAVEVILHGDFAETYLTGDNTKIIATDSMKNTVYVLAKRRPIDSIETFAADLASHFVETYPQVSAAEVGIEQSGWTRLDRAGKPHPHAFVSAGNELRTCRVRFDRGQSMQRQSGLTELLLLKTNRSAFKDFIRDEYTTLPNTEDRIFATTVEADWHYDDSPADADEFNSRHAAVRKAIVDTFAEHMSLSVQQTMQAMGEAALAVCPALRSLDLTLPNQHRIPFNFAPLGLSNDNEIFIPTDEPFGLIKASITRQ